MYFESGKLQSREYAIFPKPDTTYYMSTVSVTQLANGSEDGPDIWVSGPGVSGPEVSGPGVSGPGVSGPGVSGPQEDASKIFSV